MRSSELKIRGFIEGIEVPIIAANVTIAPNAPAAASVQIIATDKAHEIKPRSVVHLFFKDLYEGPGDNIYIGGENITEEELAEKYAVIDGQRYKLMFCGEIMGYQFDKVADSRNMTLQCADFSVYWDTCWYYSASGLFSPGKLKTKVSGASSGFFNDLILSMGEKVYEQLETPPPGYPGVRGILGGLIHLLYSIGGVYRNDTAYGGLNPYFSLAELKFHITQQIAVADDDGPDTLLKAKGFGSIWNKTIRGLGKNFTYRMALNALQPYIFYEVIPCPVARYIPGTGIYDPTSHSTQLLRDHPKYGYLVEAARQFRRSVDRLISDFQSSPRAITVQEYRSSLKRIFSELKGYIVEAKGYNIKQAVRAFGQTRKKTQEVYKLLGNKLPGKKGPRYNQILKGLNYMADQLRSVSGATIPGFKEDKNHQPPFLMNQLFRPDVWFCSPPRCNVLFPDQYNSLHFGRNYMSEVTRLLLRTYSSFFGPDVLFDKYFYAPAVPGVLGSSKTSGEKAKLVTQKKTYKLVSSRRDIMEHELYTGVLPQFERAGSHKVLGLRTGSTLAGGTRVGYAQRLANFLFFKYRYAARTMSVIGPFNPYVAPGFPLLVMDKPMDGDQMKEANQALSENESDLKAIRGMTGTHYLGLLVGVSHQLTQTGGITQYQMQYARTHNESVEALGADIVKNKIKEKAGTKTVTSYVAARSKPEAGDRGLYEGNITEVQEIDPTKVKKKQLKLQPEEKFKGEYPFLGTHIKRKSNKIKWKRKFTTLVPVGIEKPAGEFGPEVVGDVGSTTALVKFRLFRIVEDAARTEEEEIDLPLEDIVRPSWYSTVWFNRAIGGSVYQKFFGTSAVTDPLVVTDGLNSRSVTTQEKTAEAAAESDIDNEEDYKVDLNVVGDLEQNSALEDAVNFLAYIYSHVAVNGLDQDEFIRSYTWRPVATLIDMFGTPDLEYEEDTQGNVSVAQGTEGFHSRAFGDYKNLFGLAGEEIGKIIGVENQFEQANARLDTRRERWIAVLNYVNELIDRGLRG